MWRIRYITATTVIKKKKMVWASCQTFQFYSICLQFRVTGAMGRAAWTVRADGHGKREILGSSPLCLHPNRCVTDIWPGRNYLNAVHIFQQLREGVDMQKGDDIPDGGRLSRSRLIYDRTQRRQFEVAVFLRKKRGKGISKCRLVTLFTFNL